MATSESAHTLRLEDFSFEASTTTAMTSFIVDFTDQQYTFTDEVESFHMTNLHHANGSGDWSCRYDFERWVRQGRWAGRRKHLVGGGARSALSAGVKKTLQKP